MTLCASETELRPIERLAVGKATTCTTSLTTVHDACRGTPVSGSSPKGTASALLSTLSSGLVLPAAGLPALSLPPLEARSMPRSSM